MHTSLTCGAAMTWDRCPVHYLLPSILCAALGRMWEGWFFSPHPPSLSVILTNIPGCTWWRRELRILSPRGWMVMTVNRWTQMPLVPPASISGNNHILTFLRGWHSVVSISSKFLSHLWSLLPPPPRSLPRSPPGRITRLFLFNLTTHYLFVLTIVTSKPKSLSLPIACAVSWQSLCLVPLLLLQHLAHARHGWELSKWQLNWDERSYTLKAPQCPPHWRCVGLIVTLQSFS